MSPSYVHTAQSRIAEFSNEDRVIEESGEAVDCLNCEAFIREGVEALEWVLRADSAIRELNSQGNYDFYEDIEGILLDLVKVWLRTTHRAESWIQRCESRGYEVEGKDEFMHQVRIASAIVAFDPEAPAKEWVAEASESALEEHRRGQTADMFSPE